MQPQSDTEYKALLTDVIKKQIIILGPDITLAKARNVPGLVVDNQGNVTEISGEPQNITQALIDQFVQLSGMIVKKTMEPLLSYHPGMEGPNPIAQINIPTPTVAVTPTVPVSTPPAPSTEASVPQPLTQPPATTPSAPPMGTVVEHPNMDVDNKTQQAINDALKGISQ